jgi:hypothetical protein
MNTTYDQITAQHLALQQALTDDPDAVQLEAVQAFIRQARQAGSDIADVEQRDQLRKVLRQWGAFVHERTGEYPMVQLAPGPEPEAEAESEGVTLSPLWIGAGLAVLALIFIGLLTVSSLRIASSSERTSGANKTVIAVIERTATLTPSPASTTIPTPDLTATAEKELLWTAIAPTPTGTPTTPTPFTPLPTTPPPTTPPPTPTLTLTSPPPTPIPVSPLLARPEAGQTITLNSITFEWVGILGEGQAFRVTLRHTDSGQEFASPDLTDPTWTIEDALSTEQVGEYRWYVVVVQDDDVVASSEEWHLFFEPSPGPSPTPTDTPTPQPTDALASAMQASGMFAEPRTSSSELAPIQAGEAVIVLGRSSDGAWLYVRNDRGVEGFVPVSHIEWTGDRESLIVKRTAEPPSPDTPISRYPLPVLGGVELVECGVIFKWTWAWTPPGEGEWFAVRLGEAGLEQLQSLAWTKAPAYVHSLQEPGEYSWEIAICRGDPETRFCEQLAVSARETFAFKGCRPIQRP